jgi:hypothetical protein
VKQWFIYIFLIFLFFSALSCLDIDEASVIPEINFEWYKVIDNLDLLGNQQYQVELVFSFVDGDGNIGYDVYDTTNSKENFFYTLFIKEENEYSEYELDDTISYIIPYIEPQKSVRVVKGEINVEFEFKKELFPYDTIRFDVYIKDRSNNESNVESTPDIPLHAN